MLYLVSFLALAAIPLALGGYGAYLAAEVINDRKHRRNAMVTVWGLAAIGVLLAGVQQFLVYKSDNAHEFREQASSLQLENMRGQLQSIGLMVGNLGQNGNNAVIRELGSAIEKASRTANPTRPAFYSNTVPVTVTTDGPFQVTHKLPCIPIWADIQMTSGGNMWFQKPKYDERNLYLIPSDKGISADIFVACGP